MIYFGRWYNNIFGGYFSFQAAKKKEDSAWRHPLTLDTKLLTCVFE